MRSANAHLRRLRCWLPALAVIFLGGEVLGQAPGGGGGSGPSLGGRRGPGLEGGGDKPVDKRVTIEGQLIDVRAHLKAVYDYTADAQDSEDGSPFLALIPAKIKGESVAKGMKKRCFFLVPSEETQKIAAVPTDFLGHKVKVSGSIYKTQRAVHIEDIKIGEAVEHSPEIEDSGKPLREITMDGRVVDVTSALITRRGLDESLAEYGSLRGIKIRRAKDTDGARVSGINSREVYYLLPSAKADELIAEANKGYRYVEIAGTFLPTEQLVDVADFTARSER